MGVGGNESYWRVIDHISICVGWESQENPEDELQAIAREIEELKRKQKILRERSRAVNQMLDKPPAVDQALKWVVKHCRFGDGLSETAVALTRHYECTTGTRPQRGALRKALGMMGIYPTAVQINYCPACLGPALKGCCAGYDSQTRGKCFLFYRVALKE